MWIGAILVGLSAVLYARLTAVMQIWYSRWYVSHYYSLALLSPIAFLAATALVKKFAPEAKGSGIPQVLEAIHLKKSSSPKSGQRIDQLTSIYTSAIKILSSALGILGGASIGREGPTVQIASSGFAWVGKRAQKWFPRLDAETFLVAGAAAGVAAAFNTPIAGITFAIEEIAEGAFGAARESVMLAVVISGITAQGLLGDYLYFGQPHILHPTVFILVQAVLIGLIGGVLGGGFAKLLAFPSLTRLPKKWWLRSLACGTLCTVIGLATKGATAGSGYEVTREALSAQSIDHINPYFPIWKFITTILSYLSGMAGGIFSPSLSIGAGLGLSAARLFHFQNFGACALIGMVAFFSGVVQAPLTAVIIVMEMTNEHILIIPFMVAAFIAHAIGKQFMPIPLYRFLAMNAKALESIKRNESALTVLK